MRGFERDVHLEEEEKEEDKVNRSPLRAFLYRAGMRGSPRDDSLYITTDDFFLSHIDHIYTYTFESQTKDPIAFIYSRVDGDGTGQ